MRVCIHQPDFIPWLGFFDKLQKSEKLVILDDVKISRRGFANRNKIRIPDGATWITVPIESAGLYNKTRPLVSEKWHQDLIKKLDRSYPDRKIKDPVFKYRLIGACAEPANSLSEFNFRLIDLMMRALCIRREIIFASELGIKSTSSDRILEICKSLGADIYLSGVGGRNYLDLKKFESNSILVEFQEFAHPEYRQAFPGFVPNLSAIDKILMDPPKYQNVSTGR